jgi:L-threonylcarbamoyladenylate synthase
MWIVKGTIMSLQQEIHTAVSILRNGGLVAFPTETVYGLGADATNPSALSKIFAAKGRPVNHPLIVHIADISQLSQWAVAIPEAGLQLARAFWPGPLTLVLQKALPVSNLVTGGQDSIAVRIPDHPVAKMLLEAFGGGLAAPSANRFGRISPTTAEAVKEELGDAVNWILNGGQSEVGVESTIVDIRSGSPIILRPGMITAKQIEAVLHERVKAVVPTQAPRVSGSLDLHYAPQTVTRLIQSEEILHFLAELSEDDFPIALLSYSQPQVKLAGIEWIGMPDNPKQYAHELYQTLRAVDKQGFHQLIIEAVPDDREWDGIRDRLQRASFIAPAPM